jgi:Xaa-Pro dipeptidase
MAEARTSALTNPPARGFSLSEFEQRTQRAQQMMHQQKLDVLLLTTEPEVRYFSGFFTQFWLSPTRPWFLLLPLSGKPIAVIPSIGVVGMQQTWIEDIRSWSSPCPEDDGISLLVDTIGQLPRRFGRIGIPLGAETHLRMPAQDFALLRSQLTYLEVVDCAGLLRSLFSIKSAAEIDKIRYICQITSQSFAALPDFARQGDSEREIVKAMRIDLLQRGVDHSPFIVSASGADGYDDIIMGPSERRLDQGDVLIIDTGTQFDGYYCDFDRNFAFGSVSERTRQAYRAVYQSTDAGFAAARPGATTSDIWRAMWQVLQQAGSEGNSVGRMGHGLGMQLTEWPSNTANDNTELKPGMVLTLEPGMSYGGGKLMVHEENIVITEDGAEMLSTRAEPEIVMIETG